MVERLVELGKPVTWVAVQGFADGAVGRPHIALALVDAGHVSSVNEAFDLYLSRTGPAYVERERFDPEDVVRMLQDIGGLTTLNHPRELHAAGSLEGLLERLTAVGLTGMEVYYQDYTPEEMETFKALADRFGLLPLGGSDYHGLGNPQQRDPGDIPLPMEPVNAYFELARERGSIKHARLAHV
jgi:predicted metal-dependent phosphoesterase TrpH